MDDAAHTAADGALAELLEVSPQVDAAVVVARDGGAVLSNAPASSSRTSERFGAICTKILAAAERSRTELGREPVSQIEVATSDGHVFVVADATCIVAAVTDADPTVGLVFYDLKTALRSIREARAGAGDSADRDGRIGTTGPSFTQVATQVPTPSDEGEGDTAPGAGDTDGDTSDEQSETASRWRRRKR